jgi:hypothetical protein
LLLALVGAALFAASAYLKSASDAAATPDVNAFAVWQEPPQGKPGAVHAEVQIVEDASNPYYTHANGGTFTLVSATGERIVTSQLHGIDMVEECDPREGLGRTRYHIQMLPASPAVTLNEGDLVQGTITLRVGGREHTFALPEREASIHP